jgi:hypothetical protein
MGLKKRPGGGRANRAGGRAPEGGRDGGLLMVGSGRTQAKDNEPVRKAEFAAERAKPAFTKDMGVQTWIVH